MKVKSRVQMGKKGGTGALAKCLGIGRAVTTLKCGLAYAGNSIMKGDASGIGMGLDTVAKSAMEVEGLVPGGKALVRAIKAGALGLTKQLKAGKKISKEAAGAMLMKVRELGTKVDQLYSQGARGCV